MRTTDPVTGEASDQPVIATITGTGTKHLIAVVTDATAFTATTGHPIWVTAQGWTDAADLEVGDQLTGSGGQLHTITGDHHGPWAGTPGATGGRGAGWIVGAGIRSRQVVPGQQGIDLL